MGEAKNFVDALAKHKLLVYFAILWGAMSILYTVFGMLEYGFEIGSSIALYVVDLLYHLSELVSGALLVIFGIKLLNDNFLKALKSERVLVYFLIPWAASFFFWGLWYIIDIGAGVASLEGSIGFLSGCAAIFAGVALFLFIRKMLTEPEPQTAR